MTGPIRDRVAITTGARLHFGLLTHRPASGREFGGVGVMIEDPGWSLSFEAAEFDAVHIAPEAEVTVDADRRQAIHHRVAQMVTRCREGLGVTASVPVQIRSWINSHQGLGSGTQLGLAVARGLERLFALPPRGIVELALIAGRGHRSAVGLWGFEQGGLLLDGGRTVDGPGTLLARYDFPADWRFVLIAPRNGSGLSGSEEVSAFRALQGMPRETSAELCRIVLMELLPALQDRDFEMFSDSLWRYGSLVGRYFSTVQGGVFCHPEMSALADDLRNCDVRGFAQTSWGPTCAALCRDEDQARQISARLQSRTGADQFLLRTVAPRNRGSDVT